MVRKLALAVSLALGTLSVPAHALGLGELSSKSGLNQNFKGDIALLSVAPEEIDGIRVQMAAAEAFERAGVERPFYLSLLKFEPTLTANGRPVVRVTSDFPIQEPFLNFLIEVNWPKGRMMREYTVLLDPPTTITRRPAPVARATQAPRPAQASPTRAAAPQAVAPATVGAAGDAGSEYGPVQANETAWSIAKQVRPGGVSMEQMMMALLNANPQAFVDGNINRLRRGQILRIPPSAEIQELTRQAARQAYREQQDEWLAQRNERLQQTAAAEPSEGEAVEAVEADAAAASGAASEDSSDQLRIATARPEGEGEAGAGDDAGVATAASDLKSRLIVARENAETSRQEAETLRLQVDDLQARLEDMQRLLSLKDDQLAQLQDRVATEGVTPEVPLAETAETAAGADTPDLSLANQIDLNVGAEDATPTEQVVDALSSESLAPPADYAVEDIPPRVNPDRIVEAANEFASRMTEIPQQIDPDKVVEAYHRGLAEPLGAAEPGTAEPAGMTESGELVVIEGDSPAVAPATAPVEAALDVEPVTSAIAPLPAEGEPEPAVADEASPLIPPVLFRAVEDNIVPIAAGGAALLGLVGWLALRRRREDGGEEPAMAAAAATQVDDAPPAVDQPAAKAEVLDELPDSSFLDEFSPSDINALQDETGEVDPVSEADVYIAYGRYQQAEELLRQAMERDPDRLALKHKLLEVHYATRNAGAFAALAQAMADAGEDSTDEEAWLRAQDMGRELEPANPLFAAQGESRGAREPEPAKPQAAGVANAAAAGAAAATVAAAASADADAADDEDDTLSLDDLELSELTAAYEEQTGESADLEVPSEVSVLLDLDEPTQSVEASTPDMPESISLDELGDIDFEMPRAESADAAVAAVEPEEPGSESLGLESMMAQAESAMDADESTTSLDSALSAEELQAQLDDLSDLSVLDSALEERVDEGSAPEPPAGLGLVAEDKPAELEGIDQPISLDEAFEEDENSPEGAEIVQFDEARSASQSGDDEVTTKLDLARAYVEMGDEDGARSILEEVVAEGDDSQRGDAERLLGKLG